MNPYDCNDGARRRELRREGGRKKVGALASVEVVAGEGEGPDLLVTFVGAAPAKLAPEHFVIEGGRAAQPPRVVALRRGETIGGDDRVLLGLLGAHDHSVYTLRLVTPPHRQRPTVDPRHDRLEFVFDLACPPVDCVSACRCEGPDTGEQPDIDYLAKDYASFRRLMLDRLALLLPSWTERHEADLGIMLVELLAYVGDHLSYQQDAIAAEAYVGTARKRISLRRHGRLVDYVLHEGCNARAFVCLHALGPVELRWDEVAFATRATHEQPSGETFLPIRTSAAPTLQVHPELVTIEIYDWDGKSRRPAKGGKPLAGDEAPDDETLRFEGRECCLPRGARSATLVLDAKLLAPGDFLIFEELVGPRTGRASDADLDHRHVVRLTHVERTIDPLQPTTPLVTVRWGEGDALPFALCLSTITAPNAPEPCARIEGVSVARGNVVLVDHGYWIPGPSQTDPLGVVPLAEVGDRCDGPNHLCDEVRTPGRFRPELAQGPISFCAPLPSPDPCLPAGEAMPSARAMLEQDPRLALPAIDLFELDERRRGEPLAWQPRLDLLESGPEDRHFVAEIDDEGSAWLRFGEGELGCHPAACATMRVRYRVGSGPSGNVGRDTITRVLLTNLLDGVELGVRNPLPARGGLAPESIEHARENMAVPLQHAIQRAITAQDYETIAEREVPGLQSASADLLWNGSWYEAHVALDPAGREGVDEVLRCRVTRALERVRRIGHDLHVGPARVVPLRLALHVCVEPRVLRARVRTSVIAALGRNRLPDGSLGYFHPDRLTFGEDVELGRIVARVAAIEGVVAVRVKRFERLFEGDHGELAQGYLSLARDEIARLDNDPVHPENGVLDVEVEGGR